MYLSAKEEGRKKRWLTPIDTSAPIVEHWDCLDGRQQYGILDALAAATTLNENAESWARDRLRPAE